MRRLESQLRAARSTMKGIVFVKIIPRPSNPGDRKRRARSLHWRAVRAIRAEQDVYYGGSPELPPADELDRLERAKLRAIRLANLADAAAAEPTMEIISTVAPPIVARRREHRASATAKSKASSESADEPPLERPQIGGAS
jgi:hypothetical protein